MAVAPDGIGISDRIAQRIKIGVGTEVDQRRTSPVRRLFPLPAR
jgi:hypothetical protein